MNIALLSSTSPLGYRAQQVSEFLKSSSQRQDQPKGTPFPTLGGVTVSNLSATSTTISNAVTYKFITNLVLNTTDFSYPCGTPSFVDYDAIRKDIIGANCPSAKWSYGFVVAEFVVNADAFEVTISGRGYPTIVEIDGVAVYCSSGTAKQLAQAGAATTITLHSGASATNGFYNQQYVYILSGTGAGQRKRITGYVGSTKVATVDSAWSVNPDSTSYYAIGYHPALCDATPLDAAAYRPTFTFTGERTSHFVRVKSYNPLIGVKTNSSGSIAKASPSSRPLLFVVGDSFVDTSGSFGELLAQNLGMQFMSSGVGSTGFIAKSTDKLTFKERTCPPVNAWLFSDGGATGGTFTLTQGAVTTAAIAYDADISTLQSAIDTAFGANKLRAAQVGTFNGCEFALLGLGANADVTTALTINGASLTGTGGTPNTARYYGDIEPNLPKDAYGRPLPFYILVQASINDDTYHATLQAAASDLYASLMAKFPTATIIATGLMMNIGPAINNFLPASAAVEAAALAALPTINGKSPFIRLFDTTTGVGYLNGTTSVATAAGVSGVNTDAFVGPDGVHPSARGQMFISDLLTAAIGNMLSV